VAGGTVADSQPRGERSRRLLRESQIRYLGDHHGRAAARVYAAATAGLDRVQRSKRRLAASAGRPHVVITSNTLDVGGAERQRILLANGLAARGYPVTLSLLQHEGQLRAEVDERVDVVVTPWRVPRPDVATSAVVITGTTNTEAAFGMLWRHSALGHGRRRWLVAAHTAPQPAGATYPRRLARFLRRSDGVIALSRTQWDQLVAHQNLHRDRPFVVANGIPEPPDRPDRPPRPAGAPIRLAFVGRLVEAKGVQIAVEALARITDRAWTLDVWGDGPYRATLESGVPSELADRIRFRGWTADPAAVLADADLVILPSWLEAQPLALLEAMWAGVPVLANPVGAIPEMLAGGAGLLTRGPDVASWHRALRDVLDDPQRLGPIGTAGLDRVRTRYTVTAMLDGYEDAIAEVLAR
jgi:glycosyltransferase involved in cell wall biosynthesis